MRNYPLLPLLRSGLFVALSMALLCRPRETPRLAAPAGIWATDIDGEGPGRARLGERATGPLESQKKPPCVPRREREYLGACWIPHAERPPCPEGVYEGNGMCLVPVLAAKRPATSLGE